MRVGNDSFTIYPAIDLKDGQCVRLKRGDMAQATIYGDDPASQARAFTDVGFAWIHVVDLNGAFAGHSVNDEAVRAILRATDLPVQLGGGVRDMAAIETWLQRGVRRLILGSAAVRNPQLVREAAQRYPGRIVAGIDARHGHVATQGWAQKSDMQAQDLALRMQDCGVAAIIFTEITRDGMLSGVDIEQTTQLALALSIPVIASGGVGSMQDIAALYQRACEVPMLQGVIVGRALYDGRVTPQELAAFFHDS